MTDEDDFLQTASDGLPSSWETILAAVNDQEEKPNFERLWHDFLQEEGRIQRKSMRTKEEIALTTRMKKGRKPFTPKKFLHSKKKEFNNILTSWRIKVSIVKKRAMMQESAMQRRNTKRSFMHIL